jgi:hypothetical protein
MTTLKKRICHILSQPTTWRGIVLIITAFGAQLSPEHQEIIVSIGLTIVGSMLVSDNPPQTK